MKNSAQVLSHIVNQPQYKKLFQHQCLDAIKSLMPPHLQNMVSFAYVKHKVLYFVLNHPGAKQEFDIIISSIKTPLRLYPPEKCKEMVFEDIRAYVSHTPPVKINDIQIDHEVTYEERATGTFSNTIKNEKLHKLFEKIRQEIENTHND